VRDFDESPTSPSRGTLQVLQEEQPLTDEALIKHIETGAHHAIPKRFHRLWSSATFFLIAQRARRQLTVVVLCMSPAVLAASEHPMTARIALTGQSYLKLHCADTSALPQSRLGGTAPSRAMISVQRFAT